MDMKLINANELNCLLFCGYDLPNNGHYLRGFAIVMAIKIEKNRINGIINISSLLGL